MNEKKNIDRLFQEKFKDFEVNPNDALWQRISDDLPKKKKRRVIPLWWQIGGVAAAIALLFSVGYNIFNLNSETKTTDFPIVNTDIPKVEEIIPEEKSSKNIQETKTPLVKEKPSDAVAKSDSEKASQMKSILSSKKNDSGRPLNTNENALIKQEVVVTNSSELDKTVSKKKKSRLTTSNTLKVAAVIGNSDAEQQGNTIILSEAELNNTVKETTENSSTTIVDNTEQTKSQNNTNTTKSSGIDKEKVDALLEKTNSQESIEEAIAASEELINEKEKEEERNRWSITPNVAPVYFSSLGEGSSLQSQFNQNSKSSDINMSFGVTGSYAVSKRIKVRGGVNKIDLNYSTSDVFAFVGAENASRGVNADFGNIRFKNGVLPVSLMSAKMLNRATSPEIFNTKIAGDIEQRFGFIELPLEIEYRLLDKKFGVNVIGGFSTFFLNGNEIYADIDGVSTLIGEANNISDTSFSANFGLGMDYSISKKWNINLEPTFKYQLNTFNNTTGDFRPYIFGVYTGLSFKF